MTKAPERIWVKPDLKQMFDDMESMGTFEEFGMEPVSDSLPAFVSYTRTDHALALVAAAYEDAANLHQSLWRETSAYKTEQILKRTPDDATAALEARDARIRNEALREAADRARKAHERWRDELTAHEVECDVTACEDIAADIEALITEGQSDGQ